MCEGYFLQNQISESYGVADECKQGNLLSPKGMENSMGFWDVKIFQELKTCLLDIYHQLLEGIDSRTNYLIWSDKEWDWSLWSKTEKTPLNIF